MENPRKIIEIPAPQKLPSEEKLLPQVYPVIDTDLARDNVELDLTAADLQDFDQSAPGSGGEDF